MVKDSPTVLIPIVEEMALKNKSEVVAACVIDSTNGTYQNGVLLCRIGDLPADRAYFLVRFNRTPEGEIEFYSGWYDLDRKRGMEEFTRRAV